MDCSACAVQLAKLHRRPCVRLPGYGRLTHAGHGPVVLDSPTRHWQRRCSCWRRNPTLGLEAAEWCPSGPRSIHQAQLQRRVGLPAVKLPSELQRTCTASSDRGKYVR